MIKLEDRENMVGLDFEKGQVMRGETFLMTVDELLWLIGSAIKYDEMDSIPESQKFVNSIRDYTGQGFTTEQFAEIKLIMQKYVEN